MTTKTPDPHDVELSAMQHAMKQWVVLKDAWWAISDAVQLVHQSVARNQSSSVDELEAIADTLTGLEILNSEMTDVHRKMSKFVSRVRRRHDESALQLMTSSVEKENQVRTRLTQIDLNLSALHKQLWSISEADAKFLQQEIDQTMGGDKPPISSAEVEIELDYAIDPTNPLYSEKSNNTLATQKLSTVTYSGQRLATLDDCRMEDDPEVDNWLDHDHPWLKRQGWLTHDVLEHDYGYQPRFGVAALLHTDTVWVEVRNTRLYAFDLQSGKFMPPETCRSHGEE